jgi:prepilin-type N-terminal cleavage/methylation domain-containing protein
VRAGFTLIELLLVVAIIALLLGLALPGLSKARKLGRTTQCQSNLGQYSKTLTAYSADFREYIGGYSWRVGTTRPSSAGAPTPRSDVHAHAQQAVDILRRRVGSPDLFPWFDDRFVDRNYGALPLIDAGYFGDRLPEPATVCPEDRKALVWQRYPLDGPAGLAETGDPDPDSSPAYKRIMPFWSSYQMVPYAWSREEPGNRVRQALGGAGMHLLYQTDPDTPLEMRKIGEVRFPAQKVALFDLFDRHYAPTPLWHSYDAASQPLLFFDGSIQVWKSVDSNPGWDARNPLSDEPTRYEYHPTEFEPPTISGRPSDPVIGRFRWTRGGLRGIDFGSSEPKQGQVERGPIEN